MKNKSSNIILGLIIIFLGVAFLGNNFNFWNIDIFFDGWWTLFIILPCIISIFKNGFRVSSIIGIGIGIALFLTTNDFIQTYDIRRAFIPCLLVVIGVALIFGRRNNTDFQKKPAFTPIQDAPNGSAPHYHATFSGMAPNYNGTTFTGAFCTAILGSIELNLYNAIIDHDVVINAEAILGGIEIMLPYNVNVEITSSAILGGIDNKRATSPISGAPTVYLKCDTVLGGIEVK